MLILNNDEIDSLLTVEASVDLLEQAYRALAEGRAANRPRTDLYTREPGSDTVYSFKTMEASSLDTEVAALRLCSDVIRWEEREGAIVKQKLPVAPGETWVGLILLFSTRTAEPLAIFPDGVIQVRRVAATSAVAARYQSREDSAILGMLGSGWQARAHLRAMCAVRSLRKAYVYSLTRANRESFAAEMEKQVGIPVVAVDEAAEVAREADILVAATNAISRIVPPEWLRPGMHVTCIKDSELGEETIRKADQVACHARKFAPENFINGFGGRKVEVHDPIRFLAGDQLPEDAPPPPFWAAAPEIQELVVGRIPGRSSDRQITCFVNNIGTGIQFNALGAAVYRAAREGKVGREIPTEWFLESVHN